MTRPCSPWQKETATRKVHQHFAIPAYLHPALRYLRPRQREQLNPRERGSIMTIFLIPFWSSCSTRSFVNTNSYRLDRLIERASAASAQPGHHENIRMKSMGAICLSSVCGGLERPQMPQACEEARLWRLIRGLQKANPPSRTVDITSTNRRGVRVLGSARFSLDPYHLRSRAHGIPGPRAYSFCIHVPVT